MISWLFDPSPLIEWRTREQEAGELTLSDPGELHCFPAAPPSPDRFPQDPLIQYRGYVDSQNRRALLGFVEYGSDPGRSAQLVEKCWSKGIPTVLWFRTPPGIEAPYWRQMVSARSIETPSDGRLRWHPVLSWTCRDEPDFVPRFCAWFRQGDPLFPPPLVRLAFVSRMPVARVLEVVNRLLEAAPPCRFKLFSLDAQKKRGFQKDRWSPIISRLSQPAALPEAFDRPKVIDLFASR